jgi:polyisoprenoid-binding protein YceI
MESLYALSTLTTRTIVPTGTWVIDEAHSKVGFAVNHRGIATVRGEFTEFQGTLQIPGELSSAKAEGTVKAASVDTNEPQRDADLRSPDFFDVETYPELAFESTALEIIDEETLRISADVTLHGVTNEIVLTAEVNRTDIDPYGNDKVGSAGIWAGAGLTDGDLAPIGLEMETNV